MKFLLYLVNWLHKVMVRKYLKIAHLLAKVCITEQNHAK